MGHRIFACGHERTGRNACPVCGSTDLVERCDCGSGAHPRPCALHPDAYAEHCAELEADADDECARAVAALTARAEAAERHAARWKAMAKALRADEIRTVEDRAGQRRRVVVSCAALVADKLADAEAGLAIVRAWGEAMKDEAYDEHDSRACRAAKALADRLASE